MSALSSDPISSCSCSGQETEDGALGLTQEITGSQDDAASSDVEFLEPRTAEERAEEVEVELIPSSQVEPELLEVQKEDAEASPNAITNANSLFSDSVSKSFSSTPGYLANRWNTVQSSFSTPQVPQAPVFTTPPV
jgi:hypothetical protein